MSIRTPERTPPVAASPEPTQFEVFEPLAESAPVMWREAQHLCSDHCRAYHGVWQYLLLLDVIRGLRSDRAFLIQTLRERLRSERIERVLFHASFPVDVRHNAKIHRAELARWAETQRT